MKTKMQTGLVAMLFLFAFIACKKEAATSNNQAATTAKTHESSAVETTDGAASFDATGEWILYYDWGCTGYYNSAYMTVNADGTWTNSEGYTGPWVDGRCLFLFTFDGYETTYTGTERLHNIVGIMTTFYGSQGCFYMEPYTGGAKTGNKQPGSSDSKGGENTK